MSKYHREYLANGKSVKASTLHGLPWWAPGMDIDALHAVKALYDGFIPFEDVHQQLAGWEPEVTGLLDESDTIKLIREGWAGDDLVRKLQDSQAKITDHKAIKTPEGRAVIGIDHAVHLFGQWLTGTIREVVGDEAQILSSGNLDQMMQAWVCIARPEPKTGPAGIQHSSMLTFSSSYNGTMKTQINQNTVLPICDNTVSWAREQGTAFRHSKNSNQKLGTYRNVTQALIDGETQFELILEDLTSTKATDNKFGKFLDRYLGVDDDDTERTMKRKQRVKREIDELRVNDPRVAPWADTQFGWLQAVNTWEQHRSIIRNTTGDKQIEDRELRAMRVYEDRMKVLKSNVVTDDQRALLISNEILDKGHKAQFAMA